MNKPTTADYRVALLLTVQSLMLSKNMDDVHDVINRITDLLEIEQLEGDNDHWTEGDWEVVEVRHLPAFIRLYMGDEGEPT